MLTPTTGSIPAPSELRDQIFAEMRRDAQLWAQLADRMDAIIAKTHAERAAFRRPA